MLLVMRADAAHPRRLWDDEQIGEVPWGIFCV